VYAFDTDSAQGLGMVMELLDKNVQVSRAAAGFTAGGRTFKTGAALVDGATLGSTDLAAIAKARQTPVTGLPSFPVQRYVLPKAKIGLFSNSAAVPSNPIELSGGAKSACSGGFCEALFVLSQKMKIPRSLLNVVTATDLTGGKLITDGYTAFINPGTTLNRNQDGTITPALQAIQNFVNQGGRYIGSTNNGTTTARNAGITNANSQAIGSGANGTAINTPGSLYDGAFVTTNPLSWAYDSGGWIYRDLGGSSNFNPDTLVAGNGIPEPAIAARYGNVRGNGLMYKYGFDANARGAGQLANRPALIDQPFGSGRALLLGVNPFYRAWIDGEERLVANGILYPLGTPVAPEAGAAAVQAAAQPAADPIARGALPKGTPKADQGGRNTARDLRVVVKRNQSKQLKAAVKSARLSKSLQKKVRYVYSAKTATLVMRNVRSDDPHARNAWVIRLMDNLAKRKVRAISAQV
jgi:hypothetical protein